MKLLFSRTNNLFVALSTLLTAMLLASCSVDNFADDATPRLTVDRASVDVIQTGTTFVGTKPIIGIKATKGYTVTSFEDWITPDNKEGPIGDSKLTLTITANETGKTRTGIVQITSGNRVEEVSVIQTMQPDPDDGLEVGYVYFADSFDWLKQYGHSDQVADRTLNDTPNIYSFNSTYLPLFQNHGYGDINPTDKTVYYCSHYIKMGRTNIQTGIILPQLTNMEKRKVANITLSFDIAPVINGSEKADATEIVVEVKGPGSVNSDIKKVSDAMKHGITGSGQWKTMSVSLYGITNRSEIIIKSLQQRQPDGTATNGAFRWYMDNIKMVKAPRGN